MLRKWAFRRRLKVSVQSVLLRDSGSLVCVKMDQSDLSVRHWSVSLWRDPDDVPHLSPDKTEWRLISATLCGWRRCFVSDQLWFMTRTWEEEDCTNHRYSDVKPSLHIQAQPGSEYWVNLCIRHWYVTWATLKTAEENLLPVMLGEESYKPRSLRGDPSDYKMLNC